MFLANVVNLVNVSQFQLFDESVSLIVVISKLFRFVQPHLVYHYIVRISIWWSPYSCLRILKMKALAITVIYKLSRFVQPHSLPLYCTSYSIWRSSIFLPSHSKVVYLEQEKIYLPESILTLIDDGVTYPWSTHIALIFII
jgi:hypothetical protein